MLNRVAWAIRWRDRGKSIDAAEELIARSAHNPVQLGLALRTLAWQERWRGNLDRAGDLANDALHQLSGTHCSGARAAVHAVIGVVQYSRGRYDLARAALDQGHREIAIEDDTEARIDLLVTGATVDRYLGHVRKAKKALDEAGELARGCELARVHHNMARTHLHDGDAESATVNALRSVTLARRSGNNVVFPYCLEVLGAAHRKAGRFDRARACFDKGRRMAQAESDRRAECQILHQAGKMALDLYEAQEGIELLRAGKSIAEEMGYDLWQVRFCRELARAYEMSGDLLGALQSMRALDRLTRQMRA